ncbi:MAG: TRAP transporter small permease subunit, partial [Syntrophobacteraceae bacterium]
MPSILEKLDRMLAAILKWSCCLCLFLLLLMVGAGVFVRFVPISSMAWADELVEFGFAWMVFFGA